MSKWRPNKRSESGITLIALLVMIIIIVILAAITVKGIAGNEGILSVAGEAEEDYKITAEKERLDQIIRAEMIAGTTHGKIPTLRRNSRKNKRTRRNKRRSNRRR